MLYPTLNFHNCRMNLEKSTEIVYDFIVLDFLGGNERKFTITESGKARVVSRDVYGIPEPKKYHYGIKKTLDLDELSVRTNM